MALGETLAGLVTNVLEQYGQTDFTFARAGRATDVTVTAFVTHLDDNQPSLLKLQSAGINWADARPHRLTFAHGADVLPGDTLVWDGWNWIVFVNDEQEFNGTPLSQGVVIYRESRA